MMRELERSLPTAQIGEGARFVVEANEAELRAVAARLGLDAVRHLRCVFDLRGAEEGAVRADGTLRARVVQTCVISLEPFESDVIEDFRVRFVPAGTESEDIELEADDEIPYEGNRLELGEAAVEQLALALDPFPHKPDAELPVAEQAATGPFAALARLRTRQ
ncbi:MAG: DUF177 domain-containing protein [Rhodospirillales bacterium]